MKIKYDITKLLCCVKITLPHENKVNLCRIKFERNDICTLKSLPFVPSSYSPQMSPIFIHLSRFHQK